MCRKTRLSLFHVLVYLLLASACTANNDVGTVPGSGGSASGGSSGSGGTTGTGGPGYCIDETGLTHAKGETFKKDCNTCTCENDRTVSCTTKACIGPDAGVAAGGGGTAAGGTGGTGGSDARVTSAGDASVATGGTATDGPIANGGSAATDGPVATGGTAARDAQAGTGGTPGAVDADDSFTAGSLNFTATPAVIPPGQSSTLSWPAQTATSLTIDQGIGSVLGKTSVVVTPAQTTTYILTLTVTPDIVLRDKVTVTVTQAGCTRTGNMTSARSKHTATLLAGGKVLIAGGYKDGNGLMSAELYDPGTGAFSATGSMTLPRYGHTATLLPNGKVLMVGGVEGVSAELYDPATGTFTATGKLTSPRTEHTATLLAGGTVLVAGGGGASSPLTSAELYDPALGTFAATGNLIVARTSHAAALLSNGTVLLVGGGERVTAIGQGFGLTSAEVYDPKTRLFAATGSMAVKRGVPTLTLLPNGKVLVAGGQMGGEGAVATQYLEIYDPAARSFAKTGDLLQARDYFTTTVLPSGTVLITGGSQGGGSFRNYFDNAELYDPGTGKCTATGAMTATRESHTATLLTNGMVLLAGGYSRGSVLASAELYR